MKTKKERKVKVWAILIKGSDSLEFADYFAMDEMVSDTQAASVYETVQDAHTALNQCSEPKDYIIVPATITFSLPPIGKGKKKTP